MHKKFEINWSKFKGGCQSGRKVVTHNSKSDLPLDMFFVCLKMCDVVVIQYIVTYLTSYFRFSFTVSGP